MDLQFMSYRVSSRGSHAWLHSDVVAEGESGRRAGIGTLRSLCGHVFTAGPNKQQQPTQLLNTSGLTFLCHSLLSLKFISNVPIRLINL